MKKINLIILLTIIFIIKVSQSQSVPASPCPNIFNYVLNSQTYQVEGRITVVDTQSGRENLIWIKMSYPPSIVNRHPGSITPTRNNRDIVRDIQQRRPVIYKVNFPTINPLPTVQEIMSNGRVICRNRYVQRGVSEIILHYKLVVPNINPITYSGVQNSGTIRVPPQNIIRNTVQEQPIFRSSSVQSSSDCGVSATPVRLIVGGVTMQPGTWPWLAAVFRRTSRGQYKYTCGGSIIAPHAILTAAHCVIQNNGRTYKPQDILVGLGLFDIYRWNEPNTHLANAYNIIAHNDYGHTNRLYDADVAIIVLDKSYAYNIRIRPVCMWNGPTDVNQIVNQQGHVAGWGVAKPGGGTEQQPNIIETEVISTDRCRNSNRVLRDLISNRNFCAGYLNGQGPCKGDSGSGLMIDINGRWYLRGIVSGALGHVKTICDLNEYVIYTDVAKFTRWIRARISF